MLAKNSVLILLSFKVPLLMDDDTIAFGEEYEVQKGKLT